jgi:hypothetical protein
VTWMNRALVVLLLLTVFGCAPAPPSSSATTAPTAIATASSPPTPTGFALPQGCTYIGSATVVSGQTEWRFDCGTTANRDARGILTPAFTQQGWTSCGAVTATATWAKGTTEIVVAESSGAAGDYPKLAQHGRTNACP